MKNIQLRVINEFESSLKNEESLRKSFENITGKNKEIIDWLSRLKLLYGVPFNYIVGDEKLLPEESIKFFYIDPNWIMSLIDGAYSIGRITEENNLKEKITFEKLDPEIEKETKEVRNKLFGIANAEADNIGKQITGFLLRSELVSAYPGLEIKGSEGSGKELEILRMERLNPSILLCIFNGELKKLELSEPPEGIFFGINKGNDEKLTKTLRNPKTGETLTGVDVDIPVKPVAAENVINIAGLADTINKELANQGYKDDNFTSADFGLQMVQGVEKVILNEKK